MRIPPKKPPGLKKRLLFLHPNFPAQFKHLARAAAASAHDVRFLCQTHYGRSIPGVQRLKLKGHCSHQQLNALGGNLLQRSATLANQYRQGLISLKKAGWDPDVVISHSGWGCGLHVREVWPTCRHIAYVEWWFDPLSDFLHYDQENQDLHLNRNQGAKLWLRNQALSLELINADEIVAPTRWQAQQLPPLLKGRCYVIHDGIDLNQFKPSTKKVHTHTRLVTYGTRGMEPMRGFPQFIKGIISLLLDNQEVKVQIAGEDEICYGGSPPKTHGTWGAWAKAQLSKAGISHRVEWLGHLQTAEYIAWLQRSDCHVHLTHPFVASWSLLEALACDCPMVVSDVAPVRELCEGTNAEVTYVDHRKPWALPKAIDAAIQRSTGKRLKSPARNMQNYARATCLNQWSHVAGLKLTTNH